MKLSLKVKMAVLVFAILLSSMYIAIKYLIPNNIKVSYDSKSITQPLKNDILKEQEVQLEKQLDQKPQDNAGKQAAPEAGATAQQKQIQASAGANSAEGKPQATELSDSTASETRNQEESESSVEADIKNETAKVEEDNSRNMNMALKQEVSKTSRGIETQRDTSILLPWFDTVKNLFSIGMTAKVTDVDTGISFNVKRTYGDNHADVETMTPQDTEVLRKLAGGEWSWSRRAIIVEVKGKKIPASMNMMPHAGIDDQPANQELEKRSGGYGPGVNLDTIKGNDMDGHICIHFYLSKTHDSDKVDEQHQSMVMKAYEWLLKNKE